MLTDISFRTNDSDSLASEFLQLAEDRNHSIKVEPFVRADYYMVDTALAILYAEVGAQGDPGTIKILYPSRHRQGVVIQRGDYTDRNFDTGRLFRMLPMLDQLKYGGLNQYAADGAHHLDWQYQYVGACNHLFVRKELVTQASSFLQSLYMHGCPSWALFEAIAWYCGAQFQIIS